MPIGISQDAPMTARRTLGSLVPHPANIGKIAGAHLGIAAPRTHLAGGGIANAENMESNMFQPINSQVGVPNADVNFISSPQLAIGQGPPKGQAAKPDQQPSSMQQITEGTSAANGATSLYNKVNSSGGLLAGTGNNPSLTGSIQSGLAGNGYGGILTGPNAQSALADGTNGFAPGVSLDSLSAGASSVPESAVGVGQAITDSGLADAGAATADAAATAGSTAGAASFLDMLAALFADGGAVGRASGGDIPGVESTTNMLMRREAGETFHPSGLLNSAGPGRTDTINTNVPSGAYVVPADVVSGLGEGNTLSGSAVIDRMFSTQPHGVQSRPIRHGEGGPRPPSSRPESPPTGVQPGPTVNTAAINSAGAYAKGGKTDDKAPVVLAGGEHVISPDQIINKFGSLKKGHKILDEWTVMQRHKIANEMLALPGPVGSRFDKKGKK